MPINKKSSYSRNRISVFFATSLVFMIAMVACLHSAMGARLKVDDLFDVFGRNIKKIGEIQYANHDELKCSWKGKIKKFSDHLNEWYKEIGKPKEIVLTDLLG